MFTYRRYSRGAALHLCILGALLCSPTNLGPLADLAIEAQSAEEIALLEDLAGWLEPTGEPLREAIRQRRDSFEVFRRFHGDDLLSEQVSDLPYGYVIRDTAGRYNSLDALLLASIVEVESGFDPQAVSYRGATGLMQLMPSTAGLNSGNLYDPERNLEAGASYLDQLLRRYEGDLELALAAYNAGPSNVRRYGGVPPFVETRRYVDKVLKLYVDHHRQLWSQNENAERLAAM